MGVRKKDIEVKTKLIPFLYLRILKKRRKWTDWEKSGNRQNCPTDPISEPIEGRC